MNSFPEWFKDLCSDVRWFENATMSNRGKNFKGAAEFVYAQLLADPVLQVRPMVENRKHVYNRLTKMDFDRVFPQLQQPKEEKKEAVFVPASPEHVAKCVAEFDAMLKNSPMMSSVPKVTHKQAVEQGGWIPAKGPSYPMTTAMEAYNKERKIAYYRYCFDPITRDKLPTWMDEEAYNAEFDRIMIEEKKHPHWEVLREIK